jgi:uncharacterized Tic20 family protein
MAFDQLSLSSVLRNYKPSEHESEKASYGYLMSVVAFMFGLPLPVVNLIASAIFFLANRRSTFYVRWHTSQALLSQLTVFVVNTIAFSWTLKIIFGDTRLSNDYIAYVITAVAINIFELVLNMIAAIKLRKGQHVEFWFWGTLTHLLTNRTNEKAHH